MNGTATRGQVDALAAVYPSLYERMRFAAISGLAKADSEGRVIPIAQRNSLDQLLRLDGAGDPLLAPQSVARIRALLASPAPAPQPRAPVMSSRPRTSPAQSFFS